MKIAAILCILAAAFVSAAEPPIPSVPDKQPEPPFAKSGAALTLAVPGAQVVRVNENESRLTVSGPRENQWSAFSVTVATPAKSLDVSFFTTRDQRPRALPLRRRTPRPDDLPAQGETVTM